MKRLFTSIALLALYACSFAQVTPPQVSNIYTPEQIQVVGSFNSFATTPYASDYRTASLRIVSIPPAASAMAAPYFPIDGRYQWATTINVQNSGGDVTPSNMTGSGSGFLFISGPSSGRFDNKWVFSSAMQAPLNAVSTAVYQGSTDMGLNMTATGYYTFVFNDCGYTSTNAKFYVGYTSAAPVSVTRTSQTVNADRSATIAITASATPSAEEKVYVRYISDLTTPFARPNTTTTNIVEATVAGSSTSYTATIPIQPLSTDVRYYVFTSTRTLAQLQADVELDVSLATIKYDDNSGGNFTYNTNIVLPAVYGANGLSASINGGQTSLGWTTLQERNNSHFEIERSSNGSVWNKIATIQTTNGNSSTPQQYLTKDVQPLKGVNYYRLRQVDLSGNANYSNIVSVKNIGKAGFGIINTLVNDGMLKLQVNNNSSVKSTASIYNTTGALVLQTTLANGVSSVTNVDVANLKAGSYIISVNGADAQKFVIQ